MDEKFILLAIPQKVHEPPKIEDPVGKLIHLGNDTLLSVTRIFQVYNLLLLKIYSFTQPGFYI